MVFQLFFKMVMGHNSDWGSIIKFLVQNSFGAYEFFPLISGIVCRYLFSQFILCVLIFNVGIGLAFGIASVFWLKFVFNDTVIHITVTLSVSYFSYYTVRSSPNLNLQRKNHKSLENLRILYHAQAQEWAGVSGILTVMILGM